MKILNKFGKGYYSLSYNERVCLDYWFRNKEYDHKEIATKLTKNLKKPEKSAKDYKRALKRYGIVEAELPVLDVQKMGFEHKSIIFVKLTDSKEIEVFEETMKVNKTVRKLSLIKGSYDYFLECLSPSSVEHSKFVKYLYNCGMVSKLQILENIEDICVKTPVPLFS